jgi:ribonuclease III
MARTDYDVLEAVLGYHFRNPENLQIALRHTSYANEHPQEGVGDNQRLEYLGDAVLDLIVGHRLMDRYPQLDEGVLTVTRAQVVSEAGLAETAAHLDLGAWIKLGKGEERSGGRTKRSILADAFEAVLGAVYIDGGFDAAWTLVGRVLGPRIETVEFTGFYDFKTRLQEMVQARLREPVTYKVIGANGPDHAKRFVVAAIIANQEWARAEGGSKKEAEQSAAAAATLKLEATLGPLPTD